MFEVCIDAFPIQNGLKYGEVLPSMFITLLQNTSLGKVREKDGLGLNGTYRILVYADDNFCFNLAPRHKAYWELEV
jgi:hypothetical protein